MYLSELKSGDKAFIKKVFGRGNIKRKMVDMGLVPGVEVYVEKFAPLGDPMEIKVRNFHLSLRKDEASLIEVCF